MSGDHVVLRAEGISKAFPGVQALSGVDFDVRAGEVHLLLGENGAGKSTLMKVLVGAYPADSGTIYVDGTPVTIHNPKDAQRHGIGIVYQEFNLIPYLNVAQNIFLGREPGHLGFVDRTRLHKEARALLDTLHVEVDTHAIVKELGVAQQQMVEIVKALSLKSRILIMDEPTAALTDREIEQLFETVKRLKAHGVAIVYITHRLAEVQRIGDRATVLRDGKLIGTVDVKDASLDELIRMMVGREISHLFPHTAAAGQDGGPLALEVKNLSRAGKLQDVSLEVRAGEIVGLAGLVGSGRTELARAIFGIDKYDSGQVRVFGQDVTNAAPNQMVKAGVGLLPEDRKQHGVALGLPVTDNVVMASLARLFPRYVLNFRKERSTVEGYIDQLRIATPRASRLVRFLSGGTQQKVVMAKWLCTESRLLIFDEPTRGIDVGAKSEIHEFMNELAQQGNAILMISSELPEVLGMSDRIYVMHEGRCVGHLPRGEADEEKIATLMMGYGVSENGSN